MIGSNTIRKRFVENLFIDHKMKFKDLLGSGNFSDVFIGQMELENGSVKVALKNSKKLNDLLDPEKNKEASKAKKEMIQEAEVMSQLRHANITALFGMSTDRLPILIVIEFCIGGTLLGHIKKHGANISHQERMIYIHDTSAGLKYIHSMSITHRDIAARNCLISVNGFVKLSDFGMGLKIGQSVSSTNLPYRWMAPELFQARAKFSKASDVWALGILIYEIFSNATRPFFDVEDDEVRALVKSGKHPPIPPSVGQFMTQIMEQVFKLSATDRITGELFHNKVHAHCVENNLLKFQDLTLNKIEGVHRERSEHWDEYVPQVITLDKNGNEKGWGNAPEEMLANVVWRK
uniref:Non-specific protein-tyrosine kinase n=1 Tax=Caenorhabditis tropicalis TaxID=1561998 RepID=A0A1I7T968_9PELO